MKRREAIGVFTTLAAGTGGALGSRRFGLPTLQGEPEPPLAPGAPMSAERVALIEAFRTKSEGVAEQFEARTRQGDWVMPYRLFRPKATGPVPLVVYLHGSGGLGVDNQKQMSLGNIFGTRVWALPENQRRFPCYVAVPQTDRGWVRYAPPSPGDSVATVVPGLGDGARLALELIDRLCREFAIDERRIYLAGQSMGGAGVWHLAAVRPNRFAAAVICCGSPSRDDPAASRDTSVWNFHGDADLTVPVTVSRDRIAALRRAGGRPRSTEYPGVGHNVWDWAFTEPGLVAWVFSKRREG